MELKTFLSETEEKLHDPEYALQAWTNGFRTIEGLSLSEAEKEAKHEENNQLLQDILVKRLVTFSWSARVFYNAIEERYPSLSQDEGQLSTRRILMKTLRLAMDVVENQRLKMKKQSQGVDLI